MMKTAYIKVLPSIQQQLQEYLKKIDAELVVLRSLPSQEEYDAIRPELVTLCAELSQKVSNVLSGSFHDAVKLQSVTLEDEYAEYQAKTGDFSRYPFVEQFRGSPKLYSELKQLIYADVPTWGGAQLSRVLDEFKAAVWTLELSPIDQLEVVNMRRGRSATTMGPRPWDEVIYKLMQRNGQEQFHECIRLFCKRIAFLLHKFFPAAMGMAASSIKDNILTRFPELEALVESQYQKCIDKWSTKTSKYMSHFLKGCSATGSSSVSHTSAPVFHDFKESYSKKDLLERVKQRLEERNVVVGSEENVSAASLVFDHNDNPLNAATIQKVRRVCGIHFDLIRHTFADNIPRLYHAFVELPMFEELQIKLINWASKERLGDSLPRLTYLEQEKKELEEHLHNIQAIK